LLGASGGNLKNTPLLFLLFDTLTDSGGTSLLAGIGEGTCDLPDCGSSTELRSINGGELIGTPLSIPEPSAVLLLGLGLVALVGGAAIYKVSLA